MPYLPGILAPREFPVTLARFYAVGLFLYVLPITRPVFTFLIAPVILLSITVILWVHNSWNIKTIIVFLIIVVLSYLVEMMGVHDSRLFGSYQYLKALGPKINATPLLIGINWLLVAYCASALARDIITHNTILRLLLAILFMLSYDFIIEWSAPALCMWQFDSAYPPLQNFIMWALVSLVIQFLLEIARIDTQNLHARATLIAQGFFFTLIALITNFPL